MLSNAFRTLQNACRRKLEKAHTAEPLYRRALAIDEKSFGPEHPNVAIRLNNLALLLSATNRLAEAEPLSRGNCESSRSLATARDTSTHTSAWRSTTTAGCF